MERQHDSSVAKLKSRRSTNPPADLLIHLGLEKGFDPNTVNDLIYFGKIQSLYGNLVERVNAANSITFEPPTTDPKIYPDEIYIGDPKQNEEIDAALFHGSRGTVGLRRATAGKGATPNFLLPEELILGLEELMEDIHDTPIIILGAGAAGILVARSLQILGFTNIRIIDKTGEYGGIWNYKNVHRGTKNNPFPINFLGGIVNAAPGKGSDILDFLLEEAAFLPEIIKANVDDLIIDPKTQEKTIVIKSGTIFTVIQGEIVINTIGGMEPKNTQDDKRMSTSTPNKAGVRWQKQLDFDILKTQGVQNIVIIGLGNSTAEMMTQLESSSNTDINYIVLTHLPQDAVNNPTQSYINNGKIVRVFRDIQNSGLTQYEGDLPEARDAYFKALNNGRLLGDIVHWEIIDNSSKQLIKAAKRSGEIITLPCDRLFTLIGYQNNNATLDKLAIQHDGHGHPYYDYDGEIQKDPNNADPHERLYKGYYGLGAMLKTPHNPNAVTIPGIQHRLYDLLFGVILRSLEIKSK